MYMCILQDLLYARAYVRACTRALGTYVRTYVRVYVYILAELTQNTNFSYLICIPQVGFADLVVEG